MPARFTALTSLNEISPFGIPGGRCTPRNHSRPALRFLLERIAPSRERAR